jgi:hypothetical protein
LCLSAPLLQACCHRGDQRVSRHWRVAAQPTVCCHHCQQAQCCKGQWQWPCCRHQPRHASACCCQGNCNGLHTPGFVACWASGCLIVLLNVSGIAGGGKHEHQRQHIRSELCILAGLQ